MSSGYDIALARIAELQQLVASTAPAPTTPVVSSGDFSRALASATATVAPDSTSTPNSIVSIAESQVGVAEQPPGSNDGPGIAEYRTAVAGAAPGEPWCAYFASWVAQQAGTPLGSEGQGLGSVAAITSWAQQTGRLTSTPAPGDLILFGDSHVGIVESVNADGSLTTIEGNESDAVTRRTRQPGEATGFVQLSGS